MRTSITVAEGIEHFRFEPGDFTVLEFSGYDGISQLAHFDIKLLSTERDLDFSQILGKRASLWIWCWQDSDYSRAYHGVVSSFELVGYEKFQKDREYVVFKAELVPFMWRLTLNYQSRIFQDKSVPEIIEEVLKEAGFGSDDYRMSLQKTYEPINKPPREFCVQYRESDFNFISRLMEEEGIFYFFDYSNNKDVLVIADSNSVYRPTAPISEIRYEEPSRLQPIREEFIHPLHYKENVLPLKFMLKDFNFDTPQTNLFVTSQNNQNGEGSIYDYPGRFGLIDRGRNLATVRKEASASSRMIITGKSNCRSFCAGYKFRLTEYPRPDLMQEYLLTRVQHHGIQGGEWATEFQTSYDNEFEGIPSSVPYRPAQITPKPRVQGTQTAIVVGPQSEEIYVDEKGRVKIQFHWDLEGNYDEKSSCWIRVSQGFAGGSYGIMFIPRVGQEVIVDFLEGDPDQPIIVGRVYNADHQPPYQLSQEKTKSVIKTKTYKGEGANEIRFEDKQGSEQILIHAQKDMHIRVGDEKREFIKGKSHLIIQNEHREEITNHRYTKVGQKDTIEIGDSRSLVVKGDVLEDFKSSHKKNIAKEYYVKADKVIIEGGTELTIKVGSGFVKIDSSGVTIKGTLVQINSGGMAGIGVLGSPASPEKPEESDKVTSGRDVSYYGGKAEYTTPTPSALPPPSSVEAKAPPGSVASKSAVASGKYMTQKEALKQASKTGSAFCEKCP